jgi:2-keto-3-deoxy-galactonokinase
LHVLQRQRRISRLVLEHTQKVLGIGMVGLGSKNGLVAVPRFGQPTLLMKIDDAGNIC